MKHECNVHQLRHTFSSHEVDEAAARPPDEIVTLHGKTRCSLCGEEGTVKVELAASVVREMKRKADDVDIGYA